MIFLMQFGINKHLLIFQRPQWARTILLVYEKLTRIPNCTRNHVITYTNNIINGCFGDI